MRRLPLSHSIYNTKYSARKLAPINISFILLIHYSNRPTGEKQQPNLAVLTLQRCQNKRTNDTPLRGMYFDDQYFVCEVSKRKYFIFS